MLNEKAFGRLTGALGPGGHVRRGLHRLRAGYVKGSVLLAAVIFDVFSSRKTGKSSRLTGSLLRHFRRGRLFACQGGIKHRIF